MTMVALFFGRVEKKNNMSIKYFGLRKPRLCNIYHQLMEKFDDSMDMFLVTSKL